MTQRKSGASDDKRVVCVAFAEADAALAAELTEQLENTERFSVLRLDERQFADAGFGFVAELHQRLEDSHAFLLIFSRAALSDKQVAYEYRAALLHQFRSDAPYPLVRLVVDDVLAAYEIPRELSRFERVDYRDPNSPIIALDDLVRALLAPESAPSESERKDMVYSEALAPNPRLEVYRRVLQAEFARGFSEHVSPVKETLERLANLRHAQENLMTPELIELKEAEAFDDIWVVSHSLHHDLHTEIAKSIIENLTLKGIQYTYFVPDTDLIRRRVKQFDAKFGKHRGLSDKTPEGKEPGDYSFVYLPVGVFMPFDEMVIYDGDNATYRWGYVQMSYERSGSNELFMRVPERTLGTVVEYLAAAKRDAAESAIGLAD